MAFIDSEEIKAVVKAVQERGNHFKSDQKPPRTRWQLLVDARERSRSGVAPIKPPSPGEQVELWKAAGK